MPASWPIVVRTFTCEAW